MRLIPRGIDYWFAPGLTRRDEKSPKRALVIEDDESQEPVLKRALQLACPGIEVDWVDTAEAGLRKISRDSYDLVVADIFLKGSQSGIEFWNQCQDAYPDVPVLFTSAMPADSFVRAIGSSNICPPFLQKPFKFGECAQMIEGLMSCPP